MVVMETELMETDEQKCDRVERAMKIYFQASVPEIQEMVEYGSYDESFLSNFIMKHVLSNEDIKKLGDEKMSVSDIFNGYFSDGQCDDFLRDIVVGINYDMGLHLFQLECF